MTPLHTLELGCLPRCKPQALAVEAKERVNCKFITGNTFPPGPAQDVSILPKITPYPHPFNLPIILILHGDTHPRHITPRPPALPLTDMPARTKKSTSAPGNGVSDTRTTPDIDDTLSAAATSTTTAISGLLATAVTSADRDEVKVNNASVSEMKHACDDALKRVSVLLFRLSHPLPLCSIPSSADCVFPLP